MRGTYLRMDIALFLPGLLKEYGDEVEQDFFLYTDNDVMFLKVPHDTYTNANNNTFNHTTRTLTRAALTPPKPLQWAPSLTATQ